MALIILDTSAIVAIIRNESDGPDLRRILKRHRQRRISTFNSYELSVVMWGRFGAEGVRLADQFLYQYAVSQVAFDMHAASEAFDAYMIYGKGGGHGAGLNLGDCAAYALAKTSNAPLLYKGGDFSRTDVRTPIP